MDENQVVNENCEVEVNGGNSKIGLGLAVLIGSGLTMLGMAGVKKVRTVIANRKTKIEEIEVENTTLECTDGEVETQPEEAPKKIKKVK